MVATHIRLPPAVPDPVYNNVAIEVENALCDLAGRALRSGIPAESILLDPGLDLGKTWQQSVRLLAAMERFARLGHPLLLGASNKIFLGRLLRLPLNERETASAAAATAGALGGCRVLRVHDVKGTRQAVDLVAAMLAERDADAS